MKNFYEYIENKNQTIISENKYLDDVIDYLQKNNQFLDKDNYQKGLSNLIYNYFVHHSDNEDALNKLAKNDPNKFFQEVKQYEEFIKKVSDAVASNGYKVTKMGWIGFRRLINNPSAMQDDGKKTNKRYISIDLNDLFKTYASLSILAKELNKVVSRPEHDYISFKIPETYSMAMTHKDNIVIHFYDKMAKDQIENAVQNFLNAAGVKESDRSKIGRQNFGIDLDNNSDSDMLAKTIANNLAINKAGIPAMLKRPDLKKHLETVFNQVSMQSLHRLNTFDSSTQPTQPKSIDQIIQNLNIPKSDYEIIDLKNSRTPGISIRNRNKTSPKYGTTVWFDANAQDFNKLTSDLEELFLKNK